MVIHILATYSHARDIIPFNKLQTEKYTHHENKCLCCTCSLIASRPGKSVCREASAEIGDARAQNEPRCSRKTLAILFSPHLGYNADDSRGSDYEQGTADFGGDDPGILPLICK